jgi:hypothetical protein
VKKFKLHKESDAVRLQLATAGEMEAGLLPFDLVRAI